MPHNYRFTWIGKSALEVYETYCDVVDSREGYQRDYNVHDPYDDPEEVCECYQCFPAPPGWRPGITFREFRIEFARQQAGGGGGSTSQAGSTGSRGIGGSPAGPGGPQVGNSMRGSMRGSMAGGMGNGMNSRPGGGLRAPEMRGAMYGGMNPRLGGGSSAGRRGPMRGYDSDSDEYEFGGGSMMGGGYRMSGGGHGRFGGYRGRF